MLRWHPMTLVVGIAFWLGACQAGPDPAALRLEGVAAALEHGLAGDCGCRASPPAASLALCGAPVQLARADTLHASTDGRRIRMTRPMLRFFESDDELAFVLAHEMAHLLLGHSGGFTGSAAREAELAADRLGLAMLARAGFDLERAARFPQRLAAAYPSLKGPSRDYPAPAKRRAALLAMIERLSGSGAETALPGLCAP